MISSRKRLLIRPGAIGDFLVSLPALRFLETEYTDVWCSESNVPLAQFAHRSLSIGSSGLDRIGLLPAEDVFQRLRAFDDIYSWYGTAREEFRRAVADLPFHFFPPLPPATSGCNATQFFCRQVGAPDAFPTIDTGSSRRENFIILHPFASNASKRWPLPHFRTLASMLKHVQWCAGPEESLEHAVRIPNLLQLAQWIATARAYVGNDSGITHLAASVGTPVVALFGPVDPTVWAPRGEKVRVISGTSLESISPEQVVAALSSLL